MAASLATLLLLPAWAELLPESSEAYFYGYRVGWAVLLALGTHWAALTLLLLILAATTLRGTRKGALPRLLVCVLSLVTANVLRKTLIGVSVLFNFHQLRVDFGWVPALTFYGIPVMVLCIWVFLDLDRALRVGRLTLFILSPLAPLLAIRVSLPLLHPPPPQPPVPHTASLSPIQGGRPRAILMIFDEMDQTWSFEARPAYLHLPNLDRLASESLVCTQALPPTSETFRSIPSLLTGRVITKAQPTPGRDLRLTFRDAPGSMLWSQTPDLPFLFGRAGLRTVIINHYHPFSDAYMRNRPMLTVHSSSAALEQRDFAQAFDTFPHAWRHQAQILTLPLTGLARLTFIQDDWTHTIPKIYRKDLDETLRTLSMQNYDLLIVHWPTPHAPTVMDLSRGRIADRPIPNRPNLDNLALVDQTIEKVRKVLEDQGTWDETLFILTSDHWQRRLTGQLIPPTPIVPGIPDSNLRVPLIIKFPGQIEARSRDLPINNVEIFWLLEAHAHGQAPTPEAFARQPATVPPKGSYQFGVW